jgi:hypothetical protein
MAAASRAHAQRVRGTLTDSVTRGAVPGAVVVLYDSAGRALSRGIADSRGEYSVARPGATRRMRVMRIGFRPNDIALSALDSIVDARLQPVPALLHDVEANADRVCPAQSNTGLALELWEQARAGLLASVVARESSPPRLRLRKYRRTLDPVRRQVIADTIEYNDVVDARSFVAARVPWSFAVYGYMRETDDGTREYYAPDERVLLDPSFAETHCLHLIDGRGSRAAQVGIAFDPITAPERDTIVDIAGALWLDRATFAPLAIEFRYTALEPANRDSGGEISFAMMPSGVSMIERWEIRSASLATDLPSVPAGLARRNVPRPERRNVRVLGHRRIGGQIALATWPDGKRWVSALPRIEGTVKTRDGAPIAGAFVWITRSPDTARTDARGHFEFPPMAPGLYVVGASDSVLAPLGVSRTVLQRVPLFTTGNADVDLEFHPRSEIFPTICPARSYRLGTGVLLARVIDSIGAPVADAVVEVETQRSDTLSRTPLGRRYGQTAYDGGFVVCGAEREHRLVVRASKNRDAAGIAIDRWGDEVIALTLTLRPMKP